MACRACQTVCTPLAARISSPATSRHILYAPVMLNYLHSPNFPYCSMPEELVQVFPPLRRLLLSSQIPSTSASFQKCYFGHFSYITLVLCCAAMNCLIVVFLLFSSSLFFLFCLYTAPYTSPHGQPGVNSVSLQYIHAATQLVCCF